MTGKLTRESLIGQKMEAVHWIQTQDLNPYGFAFGGMIMSKFDEIATLLAVQATTRNCVTAHVNAVDFKCPIMLGDMLKLKAEIVDVGRASIRIAVGMYKWSRSDAKETLVSPPSVIVMVCMDESFKPTPILG
ncbi:MAG: acyl-CoA thioesterase [Rickettsiales bacterium]|jgi:acyl-CoA hydrolase|nr:acyl-CoA thioesterase [Rickettsiales bacterium]